MILMNFTSTRLLFPGMMSALSQSTQVQTNLTIPPGHLLSSSAWQGTQLVTLISKETKVLYSDGENLPYFLIIVILSYLSLCSLKCQLVHIICMTA